VKKPVHFAFALALFFFTNLAASRVMLSLYALHLGASALTVGLILGVFYVFPVLLSWPIGALMDRLGARWLLVVAAVLSIGALLIPYFFASMPALYASSALAGLSLAFYNVTLQSLTGMMSTPEDRTRDFANLSLVGSLSNAIGPAFIGFAMDHSGPALASLYLVVFPAMAALLLLAWGSKLPRGGGKPAAKTRILDAISQPGMWRMLTVSGLVQLAMDLFQFFIPVYGHSIALSNSAIGIAVAAFAVASFVVRTVLHRVAKRVPEQRIMEISFYVSAAGYVLVPLSHDAVMLTAVSFLFGLGIGCAAPLTMVLMFNYAKQGRPGEALGLRLTTNNIVRVVGPSLFGLIASGPGLAAMFVVAALTMGAGGLLSRPARKASGDQNSLPM
jgi:MFS family permease